MALVDKLHKFSKGKLFLALRILSRVFLLGFGIFLVVDDMLWHNIGGLRDITGNMPMIGVIKPIEIGGIHIHHGFIGLLIAAMAASSIIFIHIAETKKN
ncbi:MAG: hypothetical protein J7K73_00015 [Nanoarchaeota archaeon]|nr:hypothetical protein [Nanoarchaeota archaeon]